MTSASRRRPDDPRRGPRVAGVSRGTVSRVLNGDQYVARPRSPPSSAPISRDRLRRQPQRPQPGHPARPDSVVMVLSEPQEKLFEDPNFSVLLRGGHPAAGRSATWRWC